MKHLTDDQIYQYAVVIRRLFEIPDDLKWGEINTISLHLAKCGDCNSKVTEALDHL